MWILNLLYPASRVRQHVWRGYPDEGYYGTRWLTGLCFTQAKVKGIVLKAGWHWGSDSSATFDNFVETCRTHFK